MGFTAEDARRITRTTEDKAETISKDIIHFIKTGLENEVIKYPRIRLPQDYHAYTEILCDHHNPIRKEVESLLYKKGFILERGFHRNEAVITWEKRETLFHKIFGKLFS